MKIVKGLTAFILLPAFMFGGGFAVGAIAMDYFYPGRDYAAEDMVKQVRFDQRLDEDWFTSEWPVKSQAAEITIVEEPANEVSGRQGFRDGPEDAANNDSAIGDAALVSALGGSSINADTIYIIQEYMRNTRELTEEMIPVPENFIGMDHTVFSQVMADFDRYPTLREMQKGMVSCEVISFSPARVVVRKTYDDLPEEMKPGFYLVNENDLVTVYLGDLKTVFMNTSIEFHDLPTEIREEIMYAKYVEGEEELFGFLEAYSS